MEITQKLLYILQIVNDWLKFAEAKNAVLLAFCGAIITAIITYFSTAENILIFLRVGLLISTFLLAVSSLVCSLSFLPKTDIEDCIWLIIRPSSNSQSLLKDTDNFYFFNNLRKYNADSLLKAMDEFYFDGKIPKPYKKEDLDLASQITINSEIASTKFAFFRQALCLLMLAIFVTLISSFVSLIILVCQKI